jgi:DNA damage-binding protein 1
MLTQISVNRLTPGPIATLIEVSHFSSTFIAQHLSVAPRTSVHPEDRLVVGDGMRSVFVLDVDEGSGEIFGDQRDMATHCVLGMEGVKDGGSGVVVSDVSR